jgi:hypothetical protein
LAGLVFGGGVARALRWQPPPPHGPPHRTRHCARPAAHPCRGPMWATLAHAWALTRASAAPPLTAPPRIAGGRRQPAAPLAFRGAIPAQRCHRREERACLRGHPLSCRGTCFIDDPILDVRCITSHADALRVFRADVHPARPRGPGGPRAGADGGAARPVPAAVVRFRISPPYRQDIAAADARAACAGAPTTSSASPAGPPATCSWCVQAAHA